MRLNGRCPAMTVLFLIAAGAAEAQSSGSGSGIETVVVTAECAQLLGAAETSSQGPLLVDIANAT